MAIGLPGRDRSRSPKAKGDPSPSPPSSRVRWRSEVERHTRGRSSDGCATDRVVELIARADLLAMATCTKAVVRARTLIEWGHDNEQPAPIAEVSPHPHP